MNQNITILQLTIKTEDENVFIEKLTTLCEQYAEGDYILKSSKPNVLEEDLEEKFIWLVRKFLNSEILSYEIYGDFEITLNLKNVNRKIGKTKWEDALAEHLSKENIKVRFNYGDGNWVTVKQVN